MKFIILTLFLEMFQGPFDFSILKRARDKGIFSIDFVNIRDFSVDKYKSVDDHPYGGGKGMIMRVDIIDKALTSVKKTISPEEKTATILLDPRGKPFTQKISKQLSGYDTLIFLCGHYEGIDERIRSLVDITISLGDFVVTGGEIPTMAIIDSVARLLPGVLPSDEVTEKESFTNDLLEYPQYTRPQEFKGLSIPRVLLSGNHKAIEAWRKEQEQELTKTHRPDLIRP